MGDGEWGIGDWGLGPIPNPQSPIPNPQSPIPNYNLYILLFKLIYLSNNYRLKLSINLNNKCYNFKQLLFLLYTFFQIDYWL